MWFFLQNKPLCNKISFNISLKNKQAQLLLSWRDDVSFKDVPWNAQDVCVQSKSTQVCVCLCACMCELGGARSLWCWIAQGCVHTYGPHYGTKIKTQCESQSWYCLFSYCTLTPLSSRTRREWWTCQFSVELFGTTSKERVHVGELKMYIL